MLVTHHVDLVTSGADYVVRMLDGYIETQGAMADLQQKGILQDIETISSKNKKEKHDPTSHEPPEGREKDQSKVPKKLVEEEERARGPVSWSIYKKYVTASYVHISTTSHVKAILTSLKSLLGMGGLPFSHNVASGYLNRWKGT